MKKLTPKQIEAQIKRNNRKFKKASAAQKRVLIAKDVLERVSARQYGVMSGRWIDIDNWYEHQRESAQKLLAGGARCDGCALGGLMMSCTIFNNKMSTRDLQGYDIGPTIKSGRKNGLNKFFANNQLYLIETAFEKGDGFDGWGSWKLSPEHGAAVSFGKRFSKDKTRLVKIMQNIIKNSGTFRP